MHKIFIISVFILFVVEGRILRHSLHHTSQPAGPISSWNWEEVSTAGEAALDSCSTTNDICKSIWIYADMLEDTEAKLFVFDNDAIHALLRYLVTIYLKVPEDQATSVFCSSKEDPDLPRWWAIFHQRKFLNKPDDPSNSNLAKMRDLSIKLCNGFTSEYSFTTPEHNAVYMHPLNVLGGGFAVTREFTDSGDTIFRAMNTFPFSLSVDFKLNGVHAASKRNKADGVWIAHFPANMIGFEIADRFGTAQDKQLTGDIFLSGRYSHPFLYPEMGSHNNSYFYGFPFTCPTPASARVFVSQLENGNTCNSDGVCSASSPSSTHRDNDGISLFRGGRETYAIDWNCKKGTNVVTTREGWVLNILKSESKNGCNVMGNYVEIIHNDGSIAMYLHFKKNSVPSDIKLGSYVPRGTVIGECGNTGCSTGPHLHYAVHTYKYAEHPSGNGHYAEYVEIEPLHPPSYKCDDPPRTVLTNREPVNLGDNPWGIADYNTVGANN